MKRANERNEILWKSTEFTQQKRYQTIFMEENKKIKRIHNSMPINQVHPLVLCSRFSFLQKKTAEKKTEIPVSIRRTHMHDHDGRSPCHANMPYTDSFSNRRPEKRRINLTYNWAIAKVQFVYFAYHLTRMMHREYA